MKYDLVVSGKIVSENRATQGSIGISNGKIEEISRSQLDGEKEILTESLIFPNFIDAHVHLREDASEKWAYKEDFLTGSRAAIHGGVTTVADMPNTPEPGISRERILEKRELAKKALINILFYGGVISDNLDKLKDMQDIVCGYKIYADLTTGKLMLERECMEKAVQIISKLEKPVVIHCEKDLEAVLEICKKYNAKTHIAHVSKKEEIEIIKNYKNKMQLTCETCPHYLLFTHQYQKAVRPPIGTCDDREAVLIGLKNGVIDMLSTDHAPHIFGENVTGFPSLDIYGNVVAWLLKEMKPEQVAQIIKNASDFLDIKNEIKENAPANLTILDMEKTTIRKEDLKTKCGWSPYEGYEFPGRVAYTIYHGKIL